jgi:aspartate/methionine/tyrosine aminotransferase
MSPTAPQHLHQISNFLAMEVFARAQELERQGREILHLEFGEPDVTPPPAALNVLHQSGGQSYGYTDTRGLAPLRAAIAQRHTELYGTPTTPEQVLVSNGTSPLLWLGLHLLAPAGSDVLITDPAYACYDNLIRMAGANPVRVPIRREENFRLHPQELQRHLTPNTRAILLNSPMNPTGTVLDRETLQAIAALGLPILSDEIYLELTHVGEPVSVRQVTENAAVMNGFSKSYGMTGWRIGYLILPEEWMPAAVRLHQNLMISANTLMQQVALAVLQDDSGTLQRNQQEFRQRRAFLLQTMRAHGLDPQYDPQGAFYVFYRYAAQRPALEMALEILEQTGVALTPGSDFGPSGEGFLRFSYANAPKVLAEAVQRLAESQLLG